MNAIVNVVLGSSWKTSLIGLLTAVALAATAYAQSKSEPGWYILALGFAWVARVAKDWDKSNSPAPSPTALKVP